MLHKLNFRDATIALEIERESGNSIRVTLPNGAQYVVAAVRNADETITVTTGNREFRIPFVRTRDSVEFVYQGRVFRLAVVSGDRKKSGAGIASGVLTAPMVGTVTEVLVAEGDEVQAYQPLVVVEAMKVLAAIEAPFAGVVKRLHVKAGEQISHGAPVLELEPGPKTKEE